VKVQVKSAKLAIMPFLLKKILASLLLPLPISLILLLTGLVTLSHQKIRRFSISCLTSGIALLVIFSIHPVANQLILSLESRYQPQQILPTNIKYIVVLGGGNGGNKRYPPNTQLSSASLSRLVEGIRLYRQNPKTLLVLSGGRVFGAISDANIMNNTAIALGMNKKHMIIEAGSRDTEEEAQHLKPRLKQQAFILVTSAYHMPRAMKTFKKYGMKPVAAPTQFLVSMNRTNPKFYLPTVENLIHSDIAIHEYLGILWLKLNAYFKFSIQ
jgi:uncharacterized SAM-binding protein YcdF (DUF218 family)